MMPAQGRPAASCPSKPPVDSEAIAPLSDLFTSGFDFASLDTAVHQQSDRSIIVSHNGRRYRIESISDPDPVPPSTSLSSSSSRPAQYHHRVPISPTSAHPAVSYSQGHPPPAIPSSTAQQYESGSPSYSTSYYYASASVSAPGWGRSPVSSSHVNPQYPATTTGGYSISLGQQQRPPADPAPGPEPHTAATAPQQDVSAMMAQLSIQQPLGVVPFYGLSDGGAGAAEALAARQESHPHSPTSPTRTTRSSSIPYEQQQHEAYSQAGSPRLSYNGQHDHYPSTTNPVTIPQEWQNPNYFSYTVQSNAHCVQSQQQAFTTASLEPLVAGSIPISPPERVAVSDATSPIHSPFSLEKEVVPVSSPHANDYYYSPHQPQAAACPTSLAPPHALSPRTLSRQPSYVNINAAISGDIDTRTPVVVNPSQLQPPPPPSMFSDVGSLGRDNVLPGEDLVFEGQVNSARALTSPIEFRSGWLKVFRNNQTNDLRFHCRVDRESETYRIKANDAQLVPIYAYDPRMSNVVYIRDKDGDKGLNGTPSGIYRFMNVEDLFNFQGKLTGEKVVFDIAIVRMVTLCRVSAQSKFYNYSNARLQIWHEMEGRKYVQSDKASIVTAGTVLSGPRRDRVSVPNSRLVLYLGRMGQYITMLITDDWEIKTEGTTVAKIQPRGTSLWNKVARKGSRYPFVKAHLETNGAQEYAAFDIHGRLVEIDDAEYESYKTFEIEFETQPSLDNFVRKWREVLGVRRAVRERIAMTMNQTDKEGGLTGRQALRVL